MPETEIKTPETDPRPRKRSSFRQLEQKLTIILAADLALFVLYLITAGSGIVWLKWLIALVTVAGSAFFLFFMYLIGEVKKDRKRSHWLICAFAGIAICVIVSLICNYPSPLPTVK